MADGSKREDTFIFEKSISNVADRLDALMMVTKTCKQSSCTDPWKTLHSDGNVRSLEDALDSKFDDFYRNQVKVSFSQCLKGQLREYEGAQVEEVKAFGDESVAPKLRAIPVNFYWQWW